MNISFSAKKMVTTALLIALGVVLPIALHSIPNSGRIFLPMHIPVLMCGLICGYRYGLVCGIITPLMSSILTQMPPAAMLPSMLTELAFYGILAGLLMKLIKTNNYIVKIYISLLCSMLGGRVLYGICNALIFSRGEYSLEIWIGAAFVTALPGIIIQIILIPPIIIALKKSGAIDINKF